MSRYYWLFVLLWSPVACVAEPPAVCNFNRPCPNPAPYRNGRTFHRYPLLHPSDWWRIPVSGGEPERLTQLNLVGLYGDFVENGRYLAFASRSGLFLLDTADMSVTQLLDVMAGTALSYER
jgi:hypothetical protein